MLNSFTNLQRFFSLDSIPFPIFVILPYLARRNITLSYNRAMQIKGRNIIGFETYSEGLVGVVAQNPA
ncbi:MAG: hypothetical protein NWP83_07595, partial [Spirosomaceae bacterium]|nr:hypothetical protein [Spirosomataceae bacterium]